MTNNISHRVDWEDGADLDLIPSWNKAAKVDYQENFRIMIFYTFILYSEKKSHSERDTKSFLSIPHTPDK